MTPGPDPTVRRARDAVALVFVLNGLLFASWVSRIPGVRGELGLDNTQLGLLLLAIASGSVLAMPSTGALIQRWGTVAVVRAGAVAATAGFALLAAGMAGGSVPVVAVGLFGYGVGTAVWDVAMNVEGAAVEHGLGRAIMPRFHAGFSLGTVLGAGLGALAVRLGVPLGWHLLSLVAVSLVATWWACAAFLPVDPPPKEGRRSALSAWGDPRTLLIGVMVLALALTEGAANDWLAVALVDGYGVAHWVGVAGFAGFVTAMTGGRIVGTLLLDRFGRLAVLWTTMAAAAVGIVLIVYGGSPAPVIAGIALWGFGASLGFPVGMSAAADDPQSAAARVSVVATIGYGAFLAGPPFLGFVADRVGTLSALLVVAAVLVPSALVVPAARPPHP